MKKPSEEEGFTPQDDEELRAQVLGLGAGSVRKTYYPLLRTRLAELERFRAALDGSNDAILLLEADHGTIQDTNETACHLLRRRREELLGRPIGEAVPALAEPIARAAHEGRLCAGRRESLTTSIAAEGAAEVPVEITLSHVRIGREAYVVAVARDVSERYRAERAMALLADVATAVATSLDPAVVLGCIARRVLGSLGDLCAVYVRSPSGELDRPTLACTSAVDASAVAALAERHRAGCGAELGVARVRDAVIVPEVDDALIDRTARDADHAALLRALHLGSILIAPFSAGATTSGALLLGALAGSGRRYDKLDLDIARQLGARTAMALENARLYRDAQAAARRAEESLAQLDTLLASTPVGLAFLDRDLRYVRVNEALARNHGVPSERLQGGHLEEVSPALAAQVTPILRGVLETGRPALGVEVRHRFPAVPEGTDWLASYYPVRTAEGALLGVGLVAVDISERKRAEEERERLLERERSARGEAERASRLKDEFVAAVSHELRTPLSAILGWAQLSRRPGTTPDQASKALDVILRNGRFLEQLVSDLLDVSRIAAGKLSLERAPVTLPAVVDVALDGLRACAEAKGVSLHEDVPARGCLVLGDAARLQQVVTNLVGNAIKFTPKGGEVHVTLAEAQGSAVLTVRDTGQGIDPEFLPLAFDRFRQADASMARSHGGLGLGLSIVKHVIERHGGSVEGASPGVGRGACFTVVLPLAPDGSELAAPQSALESLAGVRVLVVEDEPDARDLVTRLLEEQRADVRAVGSGAEALDALAVRAADVVVSDIGMPGMDGCELMRRIRGIGPANGPARMPAVALTAFARPEDRARVIEAGFQEHMAKPFDPARLVAIVAGLAGARR